MKRKITSKVKECCLNLNGLKTKVDLDIIPSKSYDVSIGINCSDAYFVVLDYLNNMIMCMDDSGK